MNSLMTAFNETVAPLANVDYLFVALCEANDCLEEAVSEYKAVGDDGDLYYTYRCSKHPENSPEFWEVEL